MRNIENLEAEVTRKLYEETDSSIAEIERILRKPLPPAELSKVLSLYKKLTLTKNAFQKFDS